MPDTRWTLLGKCMVALVHATDDDLRSTLTKLGWKGISKKLRWNYATDKFDMVTRGKTNGRKKGYGKIKLKRKDKPTAKQIKARKLFARRAKRGDFRR